MTTPNATALPVGSRILHIGPPKTGTTALQAAFHLNRPQIESQGVHYASNGRHAMTAVLAAIDQPSPWSANRKPPAHWNWTRVLNDIRGAKADRVLLSSEFFADAAPEAIARVVGELDRDRTQVVVTLRPLARIIPSQWQQFVQNQLVQPFDEWVDALVNQPRGAVTPVFWRRHRHDELVARWAEVLGPDRVTVVALDDRDRDMVLRVFEQLTGLRDGTLVTEPDLANRSMTVPEIETIRAFNIAYRGMKLPGPLYSRIIRFGTAAHLLGRAPEPGEAKLQLPQASIGRIEEIAAEMMANIRASGVHIVGDLDGLVAAGTGRAPDAAPVTVTPEVAARAAMGVLIASGLVRGTGPITTADEDAAADGDRPLRPPRPVQEPAELMRIGTLQLGVVIVRRWRAAVVDRIRGLFRRGR
ncbi:MAG TPA: hypothetical protein VJ850_08860 [Candidatus Limnocylindrales bacterium]|nr:hypothetical protein [Candidatus Limnocylindrales bacterium]